MFDGYRPSERITLTLFPDEFPPSPNSWTRRCINMYEYFRFFSPFADQGIQFESNQIFFAVHDADFWIDEVTIQQGENQSMHLNAYVPALILLYVYIYSICGCRCSQTQWHIHC